MRPTTKLTIPLALAVVAAGGAWWMNKRADDAEAAALDRDRKAQAATESMKRYNETEHAFPKVYADALAEVEAATLVGGPAKVGDALEHKVVPAIDYYLATLDVAIEHADAYLAVVPNEAIAPKMEIFRARSRRWHAARDAFAKLRARVADGTEHDVNADLLAIGIQLTVDGSKEPKP